MKHKILIAYDGTDYSLKAVEYVANIVKLSPGSFEIVLFFVLPPVPIDYVEYGELQGEGTEKEKLKRREEIIAELKRGIENLSEKIFTRAVSLLKTYNISDYKLKFSHCRSDVAGEIISELENDIYKTIVIGRKGKTSIKERLIGGTAEKIIRYVKNRTVWVVE